MRTLKSILLLSLALIFFNACKKELDLNAGWQDVTIVYGILNQQDSVHYLKITKAFLGPGNALEYATIADSSNYPEPLGVTLEAMDDSGSPVAFYRFDTTTIANKDSGQFYYPYQLMYINDSVLNSIYQYKLTIRNPETGKLITSETPLVQSFSVSKPFSYQSISYDPGKTSKAEWISAAGGKRYQVIVRFHYLETSISNPANQEQKYLDWTIVPAKLSKSDAGGEEMDASYPNDAFYTRLAAEIPVDPDMERAARYIQYFFIVAAKDLNTYIEVTQPSNSIVQEKPAYSNIENGIGLLSSRYVQVIDSIQLSTRTINDIRDNPLTSDLGF